MIKKIKLSQLKVGMFVEDFNCQYRTNNMIMPSSLIRDTKIIDILFGWGVTEVYINTDKGDDVGAGKTMAEINLTMDRALHKLAEENPESRRSIPLQEELVVAREIKKQAMHVISSAMNSVKEGSVLETGSAFELIEVMNDSVARNKDALVLLTRIRQKDEYTLMHSISVGAYILNFCSHYQLPAKMTIAVAVGGLFHDIGKTLVPLEILNKPGRLTDEEFAEMRRHAEYSAEVMQGAAGLPEQAHDIGLHHHERFDGNGYPHGLKGDDITFGSQLAAIADVYDALTSDRCYKKGIDRVEGLRRLYEWCGQHFHKELTHKFIRCIGVYPIGTCVRLDSGLVGVVIGSTESVVQPVVRVFYDGKKDKMLALYDVDLSETDDRVVKYEDPEKWDIGSMRIFEDSVNLDLFGLGSP